MDLRARWSSHRSALSRGRHGNKHLQNAWNQYGKQSFFFEVLEECDESVVLFREQVWIDKLLPFNKRIGFNNSPTATNRAGFKHSQETREYLSSIAKRRTNTHLLEYAKSLRGKPAHNKGKAGRTWTDEQKKHASLSKKGSVPWNVGVRHKAETIEKISRTASLSLTKHKEVGPEYINGLRSKGMTYKKISELTGISLSQCNKIARLKRTYEKLKGVNK